MPPASRFVSALLCFALVACGGDDQVAPAAATDGGQVEALPAPGQPTGSVTGMPDGPGPGDVPLGGAAPASASVDGVAMVVPIPGVASTDGLPPLEDEPEAGLSSGEPPVILVGEAPLPVADAAIDPSAPMAPGPAATSPAAPAEPSAADAVAVIRAYYAAISAGRHAQAYALWSDGGRSSGQTPQQFAAGFADTRAVTVQPGEAGRVEGAAGSRYVEIPVSVTMTRADGSEQRYVGAYVLRRAVADGASPGQRAWRIASAELREYQP